MTKAFKILVVVLLINFLVWREVLFSNELLRIYFLNIGQGESTLIITPDHVKIMIDGGPDNSVLSRVSEVLAFWDKKIDIVILTHPDKDHVGGLVDILDNYNVSYVMYTGRKGSSYEYTTFIKKSLNLKRIKYENKNPRLGCCVYLHMLWPKDEHIDKIPPNDGSISLELVYKNFNVFLAGDLPKHYEDKIVREDSFLDVDILKVSHHGSKNSTSKYFLKHIKPELAVISAGVDNSYGHPHEDVLSNLKTEHIKTLRTDIKGTIEVETDGYNWDVHY